MNERNANIYPGDSITGAWICHENHYAFVDFRTIEETDSALLKLVGVCIQGQIIKVGRPRTYFKETPNVDNNGLLNNTFLNVLVSKYIKN